MKNKIKELWFWIVAFSIIIWQVLKGNTWHMVHVDIELGQNEDGSPIRDRLIAMKRTGRLDVYWLSDVMKEAGIE